MNSSIVRVDAVINYCLPLEHRRRLNITVDCCFEISKQPGLAGQIKGWFEWSTQGCDGLIGEKRRPLSKVDNLANESTGTKVVGQFSVGLNAVHDDIMKQHRSTHSNLGVIDNESLHYIDEVCLDCGISTMKLDETRKTEFDDALSIICFSTVIDNDARIAVIAIVRSLFEIISQGSFFVPDLEIGHPIWIG
jgi:hypothetical protein